VILNTINVKLVQYLYSNRGDPPSPSPAHLSHLSPPAAAAIAPPVQAQAPPAPPAAQCTPEQLSTIKQQLPPDDCIKYRRQPWKQQCSLTYATRCPDPVWLEDYYTALHNNNGKNDHDPPSPSSFLAIFVGCNKGFDAINALRMGSGNPAFDKATWGDAMSDSYSRGQVTGKKLELNRDVCNQATKPQFALPQNSSTVRKSHVHCIEPLPVTLRQLQRAAWKSHYDEMGFKVSFAAMGRTDGWVPFARGRSVGQENRGIDTVNCNKRGSCMNVTMHSLDTYVSRFVPKGMPINYLSVDVEGNDYDVLLGGERTSVLKRVHYLEFEYNWMGSWKDQSLHQAIDYLDAQFGFTCYWAGFNRTLWRITSCWLDHYDHHFWSNVACVNRNAHEVRSMAESMERIFLETLERKEDALRDFEHRFKRDEE